MSSFQVLRNPVPNQRVKWTDEDGFLTPEALKTQAAEQQAQTTRTPTLISSSHATRSSIQANQYADGSDFYETDRTVFYKAIGGSWIWQSGIYQVTQANIPTDLGANDNGFLLYVTDYAHLLQWNGNSWRWAPGDNGSGYIVAFVSAPSPADGWALCDGSNVIQMLSDGTLNPAFVTLPNTPGSYFRQ